MDINNLTSVYNQNPTLQGQYTLQQYLDLFGQGSSTTPTPDPDPDPTPDPTPDPGIPSIVNQNDRPGEGANFATTPGNKYGLNKDTMQTQMVTVADGMGGTKLVEMTTAESAGGIRKNMKTGKNINHAGLNIKTPMTMAFDFLSGKKNTDDDEFLEDGSIIGTFNNPNIKNKSIFQKIKSDLATKKEQSLLTAELQKQKELKAQIEREQKASQDRQAAADQARIDRAYRQDTGGQAGSYAPGGGSGSHAPDASGSTYSDPFDPGGGEKDGGYIDGTNRRKTNYFKGGSVRKYFKGGIVSLRRR